MRVPQSPTRPKTVEKTPTCRSMGSPDCEYQGLTLAAHPMGILRLAGFWALCSGDETLVIYIYICSIDSVVLFCCCEKEQGCATTAASWQLDLFSLGSALRASHGYHARSGGSSMIRRFADPIYSRWSKVAALYNSNELEIEALKWAPGSVGIGCPS